MNFCKEHISSKSASVISVLLITYNHAFYIRKAIESILMQTGSFRLEIVVADDCSDDGTSEIIDEYIAAHPNLFHLLPRDKNLGLHLNVSRCLSAGSGKYLAIIEGDDYWTDPDKLARQVEFMEEHPDFSLCFHNALVVYEDDSGKESHLMTADIKSEYTLDDITRDWNIASASLFFRSGMLSELPDWVLEGTATDLPIITILASQGRVGCLSEVMSVYRVNRNGVTRAGKQEEYMLGIVRMHKNIDRFLNYQYHYNLRFKLIEDYNILAGIAAGDQQYGKARKYFMRYLQGKAIAMKKPTIRDMKSLISLLLPALRR